MKVLLHFPRSRYNCEVIVNDRSETKKYTVNLANENPAELEIQVENCNFELTLIPQIADTSAAFWERDIENPKCKFAQKVGSTIFSTLDKMLLRVGCTFKVAEIKEHDVIFFNNQEYVFGAFDKLDVLDLIPITYVFFEAYCNGIRLECSNAFPTNRKEVISSAKKLALADFGIQLIFTYPMQICRIKNLTSDKKVNQTLTAFSRMNEAERQKVLRKKENYISK